MNKVDQKRLEKLQKEEEKLYNRLREISVEKQEIEKKERINYMGKFLCITDIGGKWKKESWILVKRQEDPEPSGVFLVSGPCVTIQRNAKTEELIWAQLLGEDHGGVWISREMKIKEVTKAEVIEVTSQLGLEYWNKNYEPGQSN